ncbi:hypothetical protein BLA29_004094 [Euroglyphus maynei]|uniref:CRAL-TRIO domain-containing protein n=1 Tax=Euroglyphus maynei TaxID=6958 RepID=A0A1Y3B8A9_EURMA|nr:hypothetical protein BLA29_004094 [Euroglyphus maynei]
MFDESNSSIIERIRERLEEEFKHNVTLYDSIDIERIRTDSWQVERFIQEYHHENETFDAILKTLKWRKSERVNEINENDFFKELWTLFNLEIHGHDHHGRIIHWMTWQNVSIPKDIIDLAYRFSIYITEQMDRMAGRNGCTSIINVRHASLRDIRIDFFRILIKIPKHYPGLMRMWLFVDQPYFLRTVSNLLLNIVDDKIRKRVAFIPNNELTRYINQELIPESLNGSRKFVQPINVPSINDCYDRLGLEIKICDEVEKALKNVQK